MKFLTVIFSVFLYINILYARSDLFFLTVKTEPSDATVQITNIKPSYFDGIPLQKGSYIIKVSKTGYITKKNNMHLDKNLVLNISLDATDTQENPKDKIEQDNNITNTTKQNSLQYAWIDKDTGLMWQDNPNNRTITKGWQGANRYCKKISVANFDDWRLPAYHELLSLVDYGNYNPAIKKSLKYIASENYWSSTVHARDQSMAWYINLRLGSTNNDDKNIMFNVMCVRGGK